jgi:hypothetical protein
MNIKRLGIGSVVGAITLYLLGQLIWVNLFADFFAANSGSAVGVARDTPIVWAIMIGSLFYAVLLTLALESRSTSKSIVGGLITGAVVGALLWGTPDFIQYGASNLDNLMATIADVLLEGVRGGIAGGVVAAVLNKVGD